MSTVNNIQEKANYTDSTNTIGLTDTISLKFNDFDVDGNKAVVTIGVKPKGKRKFNEQVLTVHLTSEVKNYLTALKPVNPEHQMKQQLATGFEVFCYKNRISKSLGDITFVCENNSKDYAANPFRVFVNKDGKASLYMVGSPNLNVKQIVNPLTGAVERTIFYRKKNHEGNYFFLAPKYYRRYVVRPQKQ